jgi:hypothetical protein
MERVINALVYPEEVVIGHRSRYIAHKRDEEIRGIFDDAMFERDKKGRKTKIFLIDPNAEAIIENRLKSISEF